MENGKQITPAEKGEHNFVTEALFFFKEFPLVNGDTSEVVDLISVPLDHKLYVGEGIRSNLGSIASIYFSKNNLMSDLARN